jgi:hypothetical protein
MPSQSGIAAATGTTIASVARLPSGQAYAATSAWENTRASMSSAASQGRRRRKGEPPFTVP